MNTIRFTDISDTENIMSFIDKYWKQDHILSRDRELFLYKYKDQSRVNFVVAEDENNSIVGLEEFKGVRSQDLLLSYRINDAVFVWGSNEILIKKDSILPPSYASIMPKNRSVDIDEETDFKIAEILIESSL